MIYGILSVLIISLISLAGAVFLFISDTTVKKFILPLVGLAVGALFGDAFLHLIPEAFENERFGSVAPLFVLFGIVTFFILEKFLSWHHHHGVEHEAHHEELPLGKMILFSDVMHNFIDGAVIAIAYAVDTSVGVATTLAVILHEIPQEIGDFGLLIHAGYSRTKALLYNFFSSVSAFVGFFVASFFIVSDDFIALAGAFAAGSFIYIAGSDLVPELRTKKNKKSTVIEFAFIMLGILLMYLLMFLE